jgi:hypothetical protein
MLTEVTISKPAVFDRAQKDESTRSSCSSCSHGVLRSAQDWRVHWLSSTLDMTGWCAHSSQSLRRNSITNGGWTAMINAVTNPANQM